METAVFQFGPTSLTVWTDSAQATDLAAEYEKGTGRYILHCRMSMSGPEEAVWLDLTKVLWFHVTRLR